MNPQLIPLAQSVVSAVTEIILLLIGAAAIGFLTAWFYQKSYFTPIIKKLEEEKEELKRIIGGLNNEIAGLKAKAGELETKIANLGKELASKEKEISELKNQRKQ